MAAQVSLESLLQTFDIDIQLLGKNLNVYNYIHTTICYSKCHIFILNGFKWYRAMKMWLLKLVWVNISIDKQWLTTIGWREYIVLFAHTNVAETTKIKPLFTHSGLGVRYKEKERVKMPIRIICMPSYDTEAPKKMFSCAV